MIMEGINKFKRMNINCKHRLNPIQPTVYVYKKIEKKREKEVGQFIEETSHKVEKIKNKKLNLYKRMKVFSF